MAKSKRKPRATNKIEGSEGALIKVDAAPLPDVPAVVYRAKSAAVMRSTLFTADFEAVIEIIAIERVRWAMLATRRLRFLAAPAPAPEPPPFITD
jgi:hypothetical protein